MLAGGLTSHHEKPTVMRLRMTNRELATTDAKIASIMRSYLAQVYRTHRPIDFLVLVELFNSYWKEETDFSEWHEG